MPTLPDWACATGRPGATAVLRRRPDDFRVVEELGFEPDNEGSHYFLWIEKCGHTTPRVAGLLAAFAGMPGRDVGFSGLKDRHARTRQWFSVPAGAGSSVDWSAFSAEGVSLLKVCRHRRKLKRGVHRANRFRIVLRDVVDPDASLEGKLSALSAGGAPNYFGEQRFGRNAGNLRLAEALFAGHRLRRDRRSMALSAARALIFNQSLSRRVEDGSWNRLQPGDFANLDGSRSVFEVTELDETLTNRAAALDLHPTGPLWGRGASTGTLAVARLERSAADSYPALARGLEARTRSARRALRMRVADLVWAYDGDTLSLEFRLVAGSFATSVVRELVRPPVGA